MKRLLVLIPSYKRPKVLDLTLQRLFSSHRPEWDLTVMVADNKSSDETSVVLFNFRAQAETLGINYDYGCIPENIGKARALNNMLQYQYGDFDVIVTMDNDMVIYEPWYWLLDKFLETNYDFIGFGSSAFWWHIPLDRSKLDCATAGELLIYHPAGIAGGLLAFKPDFLRSHPWSNGGGVYGLDDGLMCQTTQTRAVFFWGVEWLKHDPLQGAEETREYHAKKRFLNESGVTVYQAGWDE
jgi:glycosyltransferase involved in cell wall biosynthesis